MKKLILFLAAIVMLTVTACSHKPSEGDIDAVVEKINTGAQLSQDDYAVMLEYVEPVVDKTVDFMHDLLEAYKDNDQAKALKISAEAAEMSQKYKYSATFIDCIIANHEEFDSSNLKKYEKLEKKVNEMTELQEGF